MHSSKHIQLVVYVKHQNVNKLQLKRFKSKKKNKTPNKYNK